MVITNTLKLSGSKESNLLSKVISVHLHHILTVPDIADNVKLSKDFMINIKTWKDRKYCYIFNIVRLPLLNRNLKNIYDREIGQTGTHCNRVT